MTTPRPRHRRLAARGVAVVLAVTGVVVAAGAGYTAWAQHQVTRAVAAVPRVHGVFDGLDVVSRPAAAHHPAADSGQDPHPGAQFNVLLVGSDIRASGGTTGQAATTGATTDQRSDALLLLTIAADRRRAQVISLPRDSWVAIPGHGHAKINAALAYGGPPLLVRTVEDLTGLRVDHYATIDFTGLSHLVTALGGVTVKNTHDTAYAGHTFAKGRIHLSGPAALAFVRQRKNLPRGDLDRVVNQQRLLAALADQIVSKDVAANPAAMSRVLTAVAASVSVDDSLTDNGLRALLESLSAMPRDGVAYRTAPFGSFTTKAGQSVVLLDDAKSQQLWAATAAGRLAAPRKPAAR